MPTLESCVSFFMSIVKSNSEVDPSSRQIFGNAGARTWFARSANIDASRIFWSEESLIRMGMRRHECCNSLYYLRNAFDLIRCLGFRLAKVSICNKESIRLVLRWDYFLKVTSLRPFASVPRSSRPFLKGLSLPVWLQTVLYSPQSLWWFLWCISSSLCLQSAVLLEPYAHA